MAKPSPPMKPLLLYTMTAGLGDLIVVSDLICKAESLIPGAQCLVVHRDNPHLQLWQGTDSRRRFFNVFSAGELCALRARLRSCRGEGFTRFGLQLAPGSLQGFFLHTVLKKMGLLDYLVDFNLINADIITPPKGDYILDIHLNQLASLFKVEVPADQYPLALRYPFSAGAKGAAAGAVVGVHPWSRRGHLESFVWPFENWLEVIGELLAEQGVAKVVVFGRDRSFESFRSFLLARLPDQAARLEFSSSEGVDQLTRTIDSLDLLVSVNTSVVHIGYALKKAMVLLNGPSLGLWIPKGEAIRSVTDEGAVFAGSDRWTEDVRFPSVSAIAPQQVLCALRTLLARRGGPDA